MKRAFVAAVIILIAMAYQPQSLWAGEARTIDKTFSMKMGGKLVLDLDTGGDVEITGWDKAEVGVRVDIDGDDADKANVTFNEGPSSLTIHSDCSKHHHVDLDMHFTINVPAKCDVSIGSNGGGVTVKGVEGTLDGKTMGGELQLARIKGNCDLETMGGSVTVEDSEVDGSVHTMGGSVLIRNVKGNLKGSTMGGSVTYDNVTGRSGSGEGEVTHVSTMGGDIKVSSADNKLTGRTMGGDIDVGRAQEIDMSTMGGDINIGEAPAGANVSTMGGDITIRSVGNHVKAKTMGGDIAIEAVDGGAVATTMGGDVDVTMVGDPEKGKRDVELSSMGGDIVLTVPAGLSMQFDLEIKYTKKHHRECKIISDFPVKIEETPDWDSKWMGQAHKHIYGTGSVGDGKNVIKISTTNGNITIRKGAAAQG
jgi:DUF4097 and DUF4098 domain-containing protein YvlB